MSWTCNDCRIKQKQEHGLGWPFMGLSWGRCEDCGKTAECEDLHGNPYSQTDDLGFGTEAE